MLALSFIEIRFGELWSACICNTCRRINMHTFLLFSNVIYFIYQHFSILSINRCNLILNFIKATFSLEELQVSYMDRYGLWKRPNLQILLLLPPAEETKISKTSSIDEGHEARWWLEGRQQPVVGITYGHWFGQEHDETLARWISSMVNEFWRYLQLGH